MIPVLAATLALLFGLDVWVAARSSATSPLTPVRHLVASVSGDQATVTWQRPASGRAVRYQVQAILNEADYGTRVTTQTRITWDRIPFNQTARFIVTPIGPDGSGYASGILGPSNFTGQVVATNGYCPGRAGECVVVDTRQRIPQALSQLGLLHGTLPAGNPFGRLIQVKTWRISANDPIEYQQATSYLPSNQVMEVLSDGWYAQTRQWLGHWYAADPWANWSRYTAFIQGDVRAALRRGAHPYWDIQNEPENYAYSPVHPASRTLVEQQYLIGYRAIKAVDPGARIIGPSIDWMYEDVSKPWWVDLKSFIGFAAAHNMRLAAIAWHDNAAQTDSDPPNYLESPESIRDHAAEVRELIAENPAIGHPALFVDENSSAAGQFAPGWAAAYAAEENRAGIASADRACWNYPGEAAAAGCFKPNLDQLLDRNGAPLPSLWTIVDYASMNGTRVWSESTDTHLSSLAVLGRSGQLQILLGRHKTCSGWTAGTGACPVTTPPAPVRTTLRVLIPNGATSARLRIQEIPDVATALTASPASRTTTISVSRGTAVITLPAFADGEAYFLTLSPNTWTGVNPGSGNQTHGEWPPASGGPVPVRLIPEYGPQASVVLRPYAHPLVALATDQYGDPIPYTKVTFRLPSGFASFQGTGSSTAVVWTDAYGMAVSPPMTAGLRPGVFSAGAVMTRSGPFGTPRAAWRLFNYP